MGKIYVNGKLENKVLNKLTVSNKVLDVYVSEKVEAHDKLRKEDHVKIKAEKKKYGK